MWLYETFNATVHETAQETLSITVLFKVYDDQYLNV